MSREFNVIIYPHKGKTYEFEVLYDIVEGRRERGDWEYAGFSEPDRITDVEIQDIAVWENNDWVPVVDENLIREIEKNLTLGDVE